MEYARIAARHFSTDHHEYYVTPDDIVAAIPQIAAVFDQPFGNASAMPTFYCARMAKKDGLNRMLGGDGGDELFGGNARYAKQHIFSLYENVPSVLRKGVLEPMVFNLPGGDSLPLDGLDEISLGSETHVGELKDGRISEYIIKPEDFGMQRTDMAAVRVQDAVGSKDMLLSVLDGQPGAAQDIVLLNAGAAIYVGGLAKNLNEGVGKAREVALGVNSIEETEGVFEDITFRLPSALLRRQKSSESVKK
ncbi:hypothetical protein B566_EDAN019084 [Ephemera danica]|nr:hypothetical protein B566_EDAN019084 [Ephemera danica]